MPVKCMLQMPTPTAALAAASHRTDAPVASTAVERPTSWRPT